VGLPRLHHHRPGTLSDRLARIALQPAMRAKILARTRRILHTNLPVIAGWLEAHAARFSYAAPEAGAIVYVRYHDASTPRRSSTGCASRRAC